MNRTLLCVAFVSLILACESATGEPVAIKGANGRATAFDGVREAVPGGLWIRVTPGAEAIAVSWDKLDLAALKTDHPKIHEAYLAAQKGESTLLELGSYERATVSLDIAGALEKVAPHTDSETLAGADDLELKPYLYATGGEDHPLPFRFYAPDVEFHEGDEKIPLLIWLHGAGAGGTNNVKNVNLNLARKLIGPEAIREEPVFLLFPQYHDDYNWWTYTSDKRGFKNGIPGRQILDLIDELITAIPAVDPQRIYIMGMSQGGFGIPYLVTAYPNRFAAQALIAGMTRTVPWDSKNTIPSWLFYSKDDPVMNQDGTDIGGGMTTLLRDIAGEEKIKATIYEDAGHGGTLKRAIEDPGLFDWLFSQKNENEPSRDDALISKHFD